MATWSGCECVKVGRPRAKLAVLLAASCAGASVGVMGLIGGRTGEDDRLRFGPWLERGETEFVAIVSPGILWFVWAKQMNDRPDG